MSSLLPSSQAHTTALLRGLPSIRGRASIFQYAHFNKPALCRLASKLREGQSCFVDEYQTPASGSFNWAILISFTDGVEWVLRSPRNDGGIQSDETNLMLLASEAATLKYIKASSTIPVPEVFAYSCSRDNDVGIPYILMSKAQGSPLQHFWKSSEMHQSDTSHERKEKVIFQLGVITWQLSRLRFSQAGSLFEENGTFYIKTCLSRGLLLNNRYDLEDIPRGPFEFEKDYYEAQISAFLENAKFLTLYHHCFFAPIPERSEYENYTKFRAAVDWWNDFVTVQSKIDSSHNRTDYVIVGEALLAIITKWIHNLSDGLLSDDQQHFVIHHPDLSVDNIFVDKDFNITCIIDWAFCSTVPLPILLTAPGPPQSRDELDESLLPMFKKGLQHALEENVQHEDVDAGSRLCWMLSCGHPMWLFSRLSTFDSTRDYYLFKDLWDFIGNHGQEMAEYFRSMQSSEKYISLHTELKEEDQTALEVAKSEGKYFDKDRDVQRLAVSRKLTMVSDWSSRYHESCTHGIRCNGSVFVADKKLWSWLYDCLEP